MPNSRPTRHKSPSHQKKARRRLVPAAFMCGPSRSINPLANEEVPRSVPRRLIYLGMVAVRA
jgi:hypothetical protein